MAVHDRQALEGLEERITRCRRCPRLVEWRERVAREKRAAFADEAYWGRPVPGFGDPAARVYVLGLAPAAHGGNRTGRVFTGDRSGDWLFASLHRAGFANQPTSRRRDDGLHLDGAFVAAAVRCAPPANRPLPRERENCLPYAARELDLMRPRVIVCLGGYAWDAAVTARSTSSRAVRRYSGRTTRASRTRSPASSPSPCWTRFSPVQENWQTNEVYTEAVPGDNFLAG
jgi:uracil-DNA glycosylase family 4